MKLLSYLSHSFIFFVCILFFPHHIYAAPPVAGFGHTLLFDGNTYARSSLVTTAANNITLEAWVNNTQRTGSQQIIFSNGAAGFNGYALVVEGSNNTLSIQCDGVSSATSNYELPLNEWHHLAITRAGGFWALYVDGQAQALSGNPSPFSPSQTTSLASDSHADNRFHGQLDEVRIWTVAHTVAEVQAHMYTVFAGNEAGLQAYWDFEDASGTVLTDKTTQFNAELFNSNDNNWMNTQIFSVRMDETLEGVLQGGDAERDAIRFSVQNNDESAIQIIDLNTGQFRYTPHTSGIRSFSYFVSDDSGSSAVTTVAVNVTTLKADGGVQDVAEGDSSSGLNSLREVIAHARDGDTITFRQPTLTLNRPIFIDKNLHFAGTGQHIEGGHSTRLFEISGATVSFEQLYFEKAQADKGAAMLLSNGAQVTINNSVFKDNQATDVGGAIATDGSGVSLNIHQSSFLNNQALSGSAISLAAGDTGTWTHNTLSSNINSSTGASVIATGNVSLFNNIIANSQGADCIGSPVSSHNLIEDGSCATGAENLVTGDPLLSAFQSYGGVMQSFALLPASPALNAAGAAHCPSTDLYGTSRPQNKACDLGTHEKFPPAFTSTVLSIATSQVPYLYLVTFQDNESLDAASPQISATTLPTWLQFLDNGDNTASLSGTPTAADVGIHPVLLTLNSGSEDIEHSFNIAVSGCTPNPVVTNNADSGTGSLREALAIACEGSTVSFDADEHIVLSSDSLRITQALNIDGGAQRITLDANGQHRVFWIHHTSPQVSLKNLTLINGINQDDVGGGGIYADNAQLHMENLVLKDHTAYGAFAGGAIYLAQGHLEVWNSQFIGNLSTSLSRTCHTETPTCVANASPNTAVAGGLYIAPNASTSLLNNTFVSNVAAQGQSLYNAGTVQPFANNAFPSSVASSASSAMCINTGQMLQASHNLISDGSCNAALTATVQLAPLEDNGGVVYTTDFLKADAALINAGDNSVCLATDARGIPRPQGKACDIGAYEKRTPTFSSQAPTQAQEDALYTYAIQFVDHETSDGLIPQISVLNKPDWLALTHIQSNSAVLTGTPNNSHVASQQLVSLSLNAGIDDVEQHFSIQVSNTNDAPILQTSTPALLLNIDEDEVNHLGTLVSEIIASVSLSVDLITDDDSVSIGATEGLAITQVDNSTGDWQFSVDNGGTWQTLADVSTQQARLLAADTQSRIRYVPGQDFNGNTQCQFRAWDTTQGDNGSLMDVSLQGGTRAVSTDTNAAQITVLPVNDAPTFQHGNDQLHPVDSIGDQSLVGWAHSYDVGPDNEDGLQQISHFVLSVDDPDNILNDAVPVRLEANGDLHYQLNSGEGIAQIQIQAVDSGGTPNNGADTSPLATLLIQKTALQLSLNRAEQIEDQGVAAVTATLTRTGSTALPLTVELNSNDTSEATLPATLTIPAGQTSADFAIDMIDDNQLETTQTVTFTAAHPQYTDASATLKVLDSERTLTVHVVGEGQVQHDSVVSLGESHRVLPTPDSYGWAFDHWTGDCDATGQVIIDQDEICTAHFLQRQFALTAQVLAGEGRLQGTGTFLSNQHLSLHAEPAPGWTVEAWSGDCDGLGQVYLDTDKRCSVSFAPVLKYYDLQLDVVGFGRVTGAGTYTAMSQVQAQAQAEPALGQAFAGWQGDCDAQGFVVMNAPKSCTAYFITANHLLTATTQGQGSISGTGGYLHNVTVQLTATPAPGWQLVGWQGACDGNGQVLMDRNQHCIAIFIFSQGYYLLNTDSQGQGQVQGAGAYAFGSTAQLLATPEEGEQFIRWSGDCDSNGQVIMNADKTCYAQFTNTQADTQFNLNVSVSGAGQVTGSGTYPALSSVLLSTEPAAGWVFAGWQGDCHGDAQQRVLPVWLDAQKDCQALFTQDAYRLNASSSEGGHVDGAGEFRHGSRLLLHAVTHPGFQFAGWGGDCDANGQVQLSADKTCTASFIPSPTIANPLAQVTPALIASLQPSDIAAVTPSLMAWLNAEQVSAISPTVFSAFNAAQLANLSPEVLAQFSIAALQALPPATLSDWRVAQLQALPDTVINAFTREQLAALNPLQMQQMPSTELSRWLTCLAPQHIAPRDVVPFLPTGWSIDLASGDLQVPNNTPIRYRSLSNTTAPDLSLSFALGGQGRDGSVLSQLQQVVDALVPGFVLAQAEDGWLEVTQALDNNESVILLRLWPDTTALWTGREGSLDVQSSPGSVSLNTRNGMLFQFLPEGG